MKKFILICLSLLLSAGFFQTAQAQAVRNAVERAQDKNQIKRDKETLARDRQELQNFRALKNRLKISIEAGNEAGVHASHSNLVTLMQQEVAQSEAKIAQDNREVNQSKAELNSSRREVNQNPKRGNTIKKMDDRRDRRDDKIDLQDDRSDLAEQKARAANQKRILAEFRSIKVKGNPQAFQALKAKKNLLDEFEQTMVRDLGEEAEELREDKGELKEDRRETREDKRQR